MMSQLFGSGENSGQIQASLAGSAPKKLFQSRMKESTYAFTQSGATFLGIVEV